MWFYLFGTNAAYPAPLSEIRSFRDQEAKGSLPTLVLSARPDAAMKHALIGEKVFLCTREGGEWNIHGQARVATEPTHCLSSADAVAASDGLDPGHWCCRLRDVYLYTEALNEVRLGLDVGTLPRRGQAHAVRCEISTVVDMAGRRVEPGLRAAFDELAATLDAAEAGRGGPDPERIDAEIRDYRARHPYGR